MTTMIECAAFYTGLGWGVIPLAPKSKIPYGKLLPMARDNQGNVLYDHKGNPKRTWKTHADQHANEIEITEWFTACPDANLAILTGSTSGLIVLDIDGTAGQQFVDYCGELPNTPTVKTAHGRHVYFTYPKIVVGNKIGLSEQVDIRGNSGYAVAPPSINPDGIEYIWEITPDVEVAPCPDWLLALLQPKGTMTPTVPPLLSSLSGAKAPVAASAVNRFAASALANELLNVRRSNEGNRNDTLNRAAFNLGQLVGGGELEQQTVIDGLREAAFSVGLSGGEVDRTIASGVGDGMAQPRDRNSRKAAAPTKRSIGSPDKPKSTATSQDRVNEVRENINRDGVDRTPPEPPKTTPEPPTVGENGNRPNFTDWGNAQRLTRLYGKDIHYVHKWSKWLVWLGSHWDMDETAQIERFAKDTVRSMYSEAAKLTDDDARKALVTHGFKSESQKSISAMISLARSEPGISVSPRQLDTDNYLLNCTNGTIDLRTGELRRSERSDLLTKCIPVAYDPKAQCPMWISFLRQIMNGNMDLYRFLYRAIGYSLTGDVSEQCLFFMFGTGANGKSTFIQTIRTLLGEYSKQTATETLMATKSEGIRNDIAALRGARLVAAIETEENQRLAESLIKQLTGEDTVSTRFLYGEFFEFDPTFKVWLAGNHKPAIRGTDHGMWRRVRLIPFTVTIPEKDRDLKLMQKLKAELPGILAWAVQGCLSWQELGLQTPPEVKDATESYRAESDVIAIFLEETCVAHPNASVGISELHEKWIAWAKDAGEWEMSRRKFGQKLMERGFQQDKATAGKRVWRGLGIRSDE